MARGILAVYDPCAQYVERFLKYANSRQNPEFEVVGFTDLNILKEQIRDNKIKAVLFSRENRKERSLSGERIFLTFVLNETKQIVILLGDPSADSLPAEAQDEAFLERVRFVSRYQSMENILTEVKAILKEQSFLASVSEPKHRLRIDGIYSPVDKVSHPETAAAIVRHSLREGQVPEKKLYINLEPFSGMKQLMDGPEDTCISGLIYVYKTNPGKLAETLNRLKGSYHSMDVLTAPEELADLEEIGRESWPDFLAALAGAGDYQYILLDLSCFKREILDTIFEYGSLYIPALPFSDDRTYRSVLTVQRRPNGTQEELAGAKLAEFRQYFLERGMEEQLKSIREVRLDSD